MRRRVATRRERGVVLVVVLVFALLLTSSIATFLRRATIDTMIARNRDSSMQAEALARGGVRLATALVLEDKLREAGSDAPLDSHQDLWARAADTEIDVGHGATLHLEIEDTGGKLNLNALFNFAEGGVRADQTQSFLERMLEKLIRELDATPAERALYDVPELAANLIDWVDANDVSLRGGSEDEYYQRQDPPYRTPNGALASVDELRLIEGFDAKLVERMRSYVTVYPFVGGGGVNLNTAPAHVLALLYYDDGLGDLRLADEDTVRAILEVREEGGVVCPEDVSAEGCTPVIEIVTNAGSIYPPPTFRSDAFLVTARASVGEVQRTVEAVVDVADPTVPLLLSWRTR